MTRVAQQVTSEAELSSSHDPPLLTLFYRASVFLSQPNLTFIYVGWNSLTKLQNKAIEQL